jgi:hypothetical protein
MITKKLQEEIVAVLKALGYIDADYKSETNYYKIYFKQSSQYMDERHMNIVRILAGNKLMEFFWQSSVQFIYIEKEKEKENGK